MKENVETTNKLSEITEKLNEIYMVQNNLNENYFFLKEEIDKLSNSINTIKIKTAIIENDVKWLADLKRPLMIGFSGSGIAGLLYLVLEYLKK